MFNTIKLSASGLRRISAMGAILFAAVLALLPTPAHAQCATSWNLNGAVSLRQRGQQFAIELTLQHKGRVITGTALHNAKTPGMGSGGLRRVEGTVDGTLDGDIFSVQIFWPDDLTGVYTGKVLPSGRLEGETYDKNNSKNRQPWRSDGVLKCSPPNSLNEYFPNLGGKKPKKTSQPAASTPSMGIPGIVAGPAKFPTLSERTGYVPLTWNAGPAHPYAELWVKINRGPDLFVAKQPYGSRAVVVERGAHYIYIVREAGRILAAVEFVAH